MKNNKILIINRNLLRWYNELDNTLDIHSLNFPQKVRSQILSFGKFEIDYIDFMKIKLVSRK
jgi:hypothetical protein